MQNKQIFIFNQKEYTNKGGLISAQKTWYEKVGFPYLVESIFRLRSDAGTAVKSLNEKAVTIFQGKVAEKIKTDVRELILARMECDLLTAVSRDFTSDPNKGARYAKRHLAQIIRDDKLSLKKSEKDAFFEYAEKLGYSDTIRRETAKKIAEAEASPARRNTPKRERRNRGTNRPNVKGKKTKKSKK